MSKKKTTRNKKNTTKAKKEFEVNNVDINNIDAVLEDMKNLALEKTEDKKETESIVVAHEDAKDEEIVDYLNESKDNVVISTEENVIFTNKEEEESFTGPLVKCEFDEEGNLINEDEINAVAKSEIKEETEQDATKGENENEVIEENKEEKETEEIIEMVEEKKEEPKPVKVKPKTTYQDMFGGTWRGYGFDEY